MYLKRSNILPQLFHKSSDTAGKVHTVCIQHCKSPLGKVRRISWLMNMARFNVSKDDIAKLVVGNVSDYFPLANSAESCQVAISGNAESISTELRYIVPVVVIPNDWYSTFNKINWHKFFNEYWINKVEFQLRKWRIIGMLNRRLERSYWNVLNLQI